tara:strand:- start:62583 stop:64235 length:1653 start_codon:yes stop_codon:yes gene_type:complete
MKILKNIIPILLVLLAFSSCQEDEPTLGAIQTPSNLQINTEISTDGSGIVVFSSKAENAITYKYFFSDGTTESSPTGVFSKRFTKTGLNTYSITIVAYGTGGISTSETITVEVQSDFSDPEAIEFLTGGASKTWFWSASEPGHLGVGPNNDDPTVNYYANYYQAAPFEKAGSGDSECLYEDELVFTQSGETLKYELKNGGQTFFNGSYQSVVGGTAGFDFCYVYDTSGEKTVTLAPSESLVAANNIPGLTRATVMNFTDDGFMGYYIGASSYEILSLTDNRMVVRAVMGNDAALAWYHTFTTEKPSQNTETPTVDVSYTNLIWSDDFDVNGAPNSANWTYDLGAGGWGNGELQSYTSRSDNVVVEDGILRIIAKAESYSGSNYTSARLKSQGLFDFTYGRVDIRAKLPEGGGTWPALWMLGSNFETVGWPACGELDIMEHVGNNQNVVQSAIHTPSSFGNTINKGDVTISNVASEFHIYSVNWSPDEISFLVDDVIFYTYNPATKDTNTWPFNADQFLIMNIAMGGALGGTIDSSFTQSTMEVDYVRVYQ